MRVISRLVAVAPLEAKLACNCLVCLRVLVAVTAGWAFRTCGRAGGVGVLALPAKFALSCRADERRVVPRLAVGANREPCRDGWK